MKNKIKPFLLLLLDLLMVPFVYVLLPMLEFIRRFGIGNFPLHKAVFIRKGILPIRNHYYEPQFVFSKEFDTSKIRNLHLDLRDSEQLVFLRSLSFADELKEFKQENDSTERSFYINNPAFGPGDADMYYLLIRNYRPKRIIEIGSGFSTLVAVEAMRRNKQEGFETEMTCIEPFEMDWLKNISEINLIRDKVEKTNLAFFSTLEENDILFIDSSHIIRPENDVLFEFLELLPILKKGVFVHIHDIFTPRHYRKDWLTEEFRLWNEQYLLEAFLYYNKTFQIIATLHHLKSDYYPETSQVLTNLKPESEPASFWLKKVE